MLNIHGKYIINITIPTMFNIYNFTTTNHNLVTNEGLELILKCVTNTNDGEYFGYVHVGTNNRTPQKTDTIETFDEPNALENSTLDFNINQVIYNVTTDGSNLDGTSEIGVWSNKNTLISRDVHDEYSIPHGSQINIKYIFTLTNTKEEENSEDD